ncbi:DUF4249 domain-containing protein [Cytophagaceae bacterium YF14B1]|uniref:DUF4249 domain-containing protein n=1 Tax=Xanthocytophaga flava TaxID=3048013 RepID=A0AAE3U833_9BACT|nr:DUF4249 domain-containing protein [Xanthocytophaga flavus]MDJ1480768.1 DUF4249 domain-containing protein [Xanthocytophaga flavus]
MRHYYIRFFCILFISLAANSCITPYNPDLGSAQTRIVIEGIISTLPGPQKVRITQSSVYTNGSEGTNIGITGAHVYVTDDIGNRIDYMDIGTGNYETDAFVQGIIGRSYQLHVITPDDKEYISEPDLLKPVPQIDNIYWEYNREKKEINVYLDLTDAPTPGDGYLWKWQHYEKLTYCKYSEVVALPNGGSTWTLCRECCTNCWDIIQCRSCVNIASDQYVNGNKIKKQLITSVPYSDYTPYYLLIEQRSLTSNAYAFWNSVKAQTSSTGGPFDAAPAPIVGNIKNIADAKEKVLGFFGASDIIQRPYWQERNQIDDTPNPVQPPYCAPVTGPPPVCFECIEGAGYRTSFQPPGWDR